MSEDKLRGHKINLLLSAPRVWKTKDIVETIDQMIADLQPDGIPFEEVSVTADPLNEDTPMPDAILDTLTIIELYVKDLRTKSEEYSVLEPLQEGIERLEHGLIDVAACMRCIDKPTHQQGVEVHVLDKDALDGAPIEILHALAHKLGLSEGECKTMDKDGFLEWISGTTNSKRTIN